MPLDELLLAALDELAAVDELDELLAVPDELEAPDELVDELATLLLDELDGSPLLELLDPSAGRSGSTP